MIEAHRPVIGAPRAREACARGPYRDLAEPAAEARGDGEARLLLWAAFATGALRCVEAIVAHETWGAEASIGMMLCMFAGRELAAEAARRWAAGRRVPHAL